ncbi:type IV secretory system conjugative DNA transfer family protein [Clostridium sp. C2-6-12]|uniref:type IV secretory system conjugative DNA transfer family protein n=1 Tax=Clostridium sp. C2-6-12 TaxID=2698832 RepID=UPI001371A91A|nr:type IV secretory system conjugative DNA transfer family protein [Clostridium sp. C2-6-12]
MLKQPLSQLVSDYEGYYATALDSELYNYNVIDTFDELLQKSIYSDYRSKVSKNKSNDDCVDSSSFSNMNNYCKTNNVQSVLLKSTKFEELLKAMYHPQQISLITGFAPIRIYDTCLRLGINTGVILNKDSGAKKDIVLPDYIYILNESQNGAKNLFESLNRPYILKYHTWDDKKEFPYLELEDFPEELNKLLPYHLENFLAIYEDQL